MAQTTKTFPTFFQEQTLSTTYPYIAGIDEVGRGAFAGPVVVSAVIFSQETLFANHSSCLIAEINDSKKVLPKKRELLAAYIQREALCAHVAKRSVAHIDTFGVGHATEDAFSDVITKLLQHIPANKLYVLIDGQLAKPLAVLPANQQKTIIRGDQKSISIAAASIVAKVYRDNLMIALDKQYPKYAFAKNKGYGTKEHRRYLQSENVCPEHRKSFLGKMKLLSL